MWGDGTKPGPVSCLQKDREFRAMKAEIEHDSRSACLKARGSPEWPGMVGAHSTFSCLTLIVLGMDTIQTYAKEVCPGIPHPHDPS